MQSVSSGNIMQMPEVFFKLSYTLVYTNMTVILHICTCIANNKSQTSAFRKISV